MHTFRRLTKQRKGRINCIKTNMLLTIPNMNYRNDGIDENNLDKTMTMQREDQLGHPLTLVVPVAGGDGSRLAALATEGDELVGEIQDFDVLCGRGKSHVSHPGNIRYQELVKMNRERYFNAATNQEKRDITMEIVYELCRKGRFLEKQKDSSSWIVLDTERARIKVAQAVQYKHRRAGGNTIKKLRKRKLETEVGGLQGTVASPLSSQLAALTDSSTSTKSLTEGGLRFAMGLASQQQEGVFDASNSLGSQLQLLQQQLQPDPLFQSQLHEQQVFQLQQERIRQLQRQQQEQQLHYNRQSSDMQQQNSLITSAAARAMLGQSSDQPNASMHQSNMRTQVQQGQNDPLTLSLHSFSQPESQLTPTAALSQAFSLGTGTSAPSAASFLYQQPQATSSYDVYPESVVQRFANLERVGDLNQPASRRASLLDPLSLSESGAHRPFDAASFVWAAQQLAQSQQPQVQQAQAQQPQVQTQHQDVPDMEPNPFPDLPYQR